MTTMKAELDKARSDANEALRHAHQAEAQAQADREDLRATQEVLQETTRRCAAAENQIQTVSGRLGDITPADTARVQVLEHQLKTIMGIYLLPPGLPRPACAFIAMSSLRSACRRGAGEEGRSTGFNAAE